MASGGRPPADNLYRLATLRVGDIDDGLAARWDAMPERRAGQADIYDSYAWLSSWLNAGPAGVADRLVIPAVVAGDEPMALLPLLRQRSGRAAIGGADLRTRARPVLGAADPSPDLLDALAEAVAAAGVRTLTVHRLPSRDPATPMFLRALQRAGFDVAVHERSYDQIAPASDGWQAYSQALKGFANYAKRFTGRLAALWDVDCDEYGTSADRPVAHGFAVYEQLQHRSWKHAFTPAIRRQRADLLSRAEARGWARVYVLRVAGAPVAAHVWFRLGGVATWLSTAYDRTLAAFSPGTVIMWHAQARLFGQNPPQVVDLLPGANPQKDRLTIERPPLLVTDAVRRTLWSGVTLPAGQRARQVRRGLAARTRARFARSASRPVDAPSRLVPVQPGTDGRGARAVVPDTALRRYLAAASGEPSPAACAAAWASDDQWFFLNDGPRALLRVSLATEPPIVRETVVLDPAAAPIDLAQQFARHIGQAVLFDQMTVRRPVLPWPAAWRVSGGAPDDRPPSRWAGVNADAR